jgi:tetratricopeptide (TPR) repeat protein
MQRIEQIKEFLKDSPNDAFLNYALAQEWIKTGDLNAAMDQFLMLIENHPEYLATYYHLGKLYIKLGRKEEAMSIFDTGIDKAKKAGEQHTLSELQSAKLELEYDDD